MIAYQQRGKRSFVRRRFLRIKTKHFTVAIAVSQEVGTRRKMRCPGFLEYGTIVCRIFRYIFL